MQIWTINQIAQMIQTYTSLPFVNSIIALHLQKITETLRIFETPQLSIDRAVSQLGMRMLALKQDTPGQLNISDSN